MTSTISRLPRKGHLLLVVCATLLFAAILSFGRTQSAAAQGGGPQAIITWRAESLAPSDYQGKILPIANSPMSASFELIEAGRPIDLSKQTIYWYVDGDLVGGGAGIKSIAFRAPSRGETAELQIQVPAFRGSLLFQSVTIPLVRPEAVIEAPLPRGEFSRIPLRVRARAYFFNVRDEDDLTFSWRVNGELPPGSEDPLALSIEFGSGVPSGFAVSIRLSIQNPASFREIASQNINLTFTQ